MLKLRLTVDIERGTDLRISQLLRDNDDGFACRKHVARRCLSGRVRRERAPEGGLGCFLEQTVHHFWRRASRRVNGAAPSRRQGRILAPEASRGQVDAGSISPAMKMRHAPGCAWRCHRLSLSLTSKGPARGRNHARIKAADMQPTRELSTTTRPPFSTLRARAMRTPTSSTGRGGCAIRTSTFGSAMIGL